MFKKPWILTQEWHDVLFLHWPVSPDTLRKHIPTELELDLYNNEAWIGLIFFKVKGNRPRFIPPVPGMSSFLEINIRTYVTYKGRAGVYFFSLDINNPFIVKLATLGNFLPYKHAKISLKRRNNAFTIKSIRFDKNAHPEHLITSFEVVSQVIERNHFEQWLTERYHLWAKPKDHLFRVDTIHSPWKLQNVSGTIHVNTMGSFLKSNFQGKPPIAHYSKMKKARVFSPIKES
ncbi:MAG: YqjF family protein [Paenisporosarcina sp.]